MSKMPISARAGTVIDHRFAVPIKARNKTHGLYDKSQRLYQAGGDYRQFVYQKKGWITLDIEVWAHLDREYDTRWLEMVDLPNNEVYRCDFYTAKRHVEIYSAGIGQRVGIPLQFWEVRDQKGTVLREASPG